MTGDEERNEAVTDEPAVSHGDAAERPGGSAKVAHLVTGLILLAVGVMWLLDAAGAVEIRWRVMLPAALVVVGVAVLVLSALGRTGDLVVLGIVLTVLVVVSALAPDRLSARIGEQVVRPASAVDVRGEYAHGIGQLEIDLRAVELTDSTTVAASVGIGELRVLVPAEATVVVAGSAGVGEVSALDRTSAGVGASLDERFHVDGGPTLHLELSVGIGKVEVRR